MVCVKILPHDLVCKYGKNSAIPSLTNSIANLGPPKTLGAVTFGRTLESPTKKRSAYWDQY